MEAASVALAVEALLMDLEVIMEEAIIVMAMEVIAPMAPGVMVGME